MEMIGKWVFLFLTIVAFSCSGPELSKNETEQFDPKLASGFKLLEANCFSCHDPNGKAEKRVAPTLESIKSHYIYTNVTEEEFAAELLDYVNFPNPEKSKMRNAVRVFGLMPKLNMNEDQIKDIAAYIYRIPIEDPNWYEQEFGKEKEKYKDFSLMDKSNSLENAKSYAMATKAVLGKNLLNAIKTKGADGAVSFCSERALPLTDSMAINQGVQIKRVSDQNRNPDNLANNEELGYINRMKKNIEIGEQPYPELVKKELVDIAYIPIMTNEMCLQCHGKVGEQVNEPTLKKIKSLYPDDLATGYDVEQLRGIWVVEMEKQEN